MAFHIQDMSHAQYVLRTANGMMNNRDPKVAQRAREMKALAEAYIKQHSKK